MFVDLGIKLLAAQETLDGAMITTGVTGLIAGRKRVMDIAFGAIGFAADGVYHRVAVASELRIFGFEVLNELQNLDRRMSFERFGEKFVEALGAAPAVQAGFDRCQRRHGGGARGH